MAKRKKYKRANNNLENTTHKTKKIEQHEPDKENRGELRYMYFLFVWSFFYQHDIPGLKQLT